MKRIAALVITFFLVSSVEAENYKCTDPETGDITYSQSRCAGAKSESVDATSNSSGDRGVESHGKSACFKAIRSRLKDPESMKVDAVGDMKLNTVQYAGQPILAYKLLAFVNAKNSYGGYTGEKLWTCILAQHDKIVLRVIPPD